MKKLSFAFLTTIISILTTAIAFAEEKVVKAAVSVDVGENVVKLVHNLAAQIGTTADKVFPWYVKQVYISGIVSLTLTVSLLFAGIALTIFGVKHVEKHKRFRLDKCDRWEGNETQEGIGIAFTVIGLILTAVCTAILLFGWLAEWATHIMNPEYAAMESMTATFSKLLH